MERRVLLAIFLAFLVLYTWQALFVKPVPKPGAATAGATSGATPPVDAAAPAATGAGATESAAAAGSPAPTASAEGATPAPSPADAAAAPLVSETAERDVRVETNDVIAVFTNRGARLKSWRLKRYLDQEKLPQELVVAVDKQPLPFALQVADAAATAALNGGLYSVSGAPTAPLTSDSARVRFEYATQNGLHAVKEFGIAASGYIVEFTGVVER